MKIVISPSKNSWEELCKRPAIINSELEDVVRNIINDVKLFGDQAVINYSERFDKVNPGTLKVSQDEITASSGMVPQELKEAIDLARRNIEKFHSAQLIPENIIETSTGVKCWRKNVAIEKVGLYIPGGSAPLFSTVLMLAIPAKIAGCKEIVICTPPDRNGQANPIILYTAGLLGISSIFKAGGTQAIAAMAYGTETIPKVYKIFGPGNQFVTKSKMLIQQDGISIDLPAGPSEVLVIADKNANPSFVAADLLSQAEHGNDSQVIMLTDCRDLMNQVKSELYIQLNKIPRKLIASKALDNSMLIHLDSLDDCIDFSNEYAPEHLIINTTDFNSISEKIVNAGSVFLGKYSCESAGDYATGTNHTLPTNGYARSYSGVSTESFIKKISFQEVSDMGIQKLGPAIMMMAETELLQAHKNAVNIRLKTLENVRN
jgi:histidinol dehydrogenase